MKTKAKTEQVVEVIRLGKDEVNLVEYPFASLSKVPGATVIEHTWESRHPLTHQGVTAVWRVEGSQQLGLPTPTDERVYLVLMEMTREAGFTQKVSFSRYQAIQRLGWPDNAQSYRLLTESLRRLSSATITSENVIWNPEAQAFVDVGFHIIDEYKIVAGKPGRKKANASADDAQLSHFVWSNVLHDSFRNGKIRSIDLGFALSLRGSIALRLYRYLDKKAHDGKSTFEIELTRLCELHLGMAAANYTSTLKTRLQPAHEELQTRGFLGQTTYQPMKTRDGEKVCYTFPPANSESLRASTPSSDAKSGAVESRALETGSPLQVSTPPKAPTKKKQVKVSDQSDTQTNLAKLWDKARLADLQPDMHSMDVRPGDVSAAASTEDIRASVEKKQSDEQLWLFERMLEIKVSPSIARELLQTTSPAQLQLQFDCLKDREPRDCAAIFVKAVREGWEPPAKYLQRLKAEERAKQDKMDKEVAAARKVAQEAIQREEKASQEQEAADLDARWEQLEPAVREQIDFQARQRLGVLGQAGRAQAALKAMRRNLLREKFAVGASDEAEPLTN